MKKHAILFALPLALLLAVCILGTAVAEGPADWLGKPMPDFTVTDANGDRFTLSEVLRTKKAVLVNFWATWCGPCVMEFPYMEEAYQAYKDQVEIIALTVEETDTDEVIRAFAKEWELSFPMASDTEAGMGARFTENGIPTSVLVDRFGNIALVEVGAQSRADAFTSAFDLLLSDDYTQTVTLKGFPGVKPDIAPVEDARLAAAVGKPPFCVTSSGDPFAWPFRPAKSGGKNVLAASNVGRMFTFAEVIAEIDAQAGDVFVFEAAINTVGFYERLVVSLNGEKVKAFSGQMDWFSYAVPLQEGENVVSLRYDKSIEHLMGAPNGGEHALLRSFRLLSGAAGAKALAANPAFAFSDETAIIVTDVNAREVRFTNMDGSDTMQQLYGANTRAYVVNGRVAHCMAGLSAQYDPDEVFLNENCTGTMHTANDFQNTLLTIPLNSEEETGLTSTLVLMYHTLDSRIANLVLFDSEASMLAFCDRLKNRGYECSWAYVDGRTDVGEIPLPESVTYTVRFIDPSGKPVPGCAINFCTNEMCVPVKADKSGVARFTGAPYAYHLQVITVPKGYAFDTAQTFTAPLLGGDLTFTVEKKKK